MDIAVSPKTSKEAKAAKLSPDQLAFADLVATGWPPEDAWAVAIRKGVTWKKSALKEEIEQLHLSPAVQERIESTRNVLSTRQKEAVEKATKSERDKVITRAMSKENMLFNLQTALDSMKVGSKEWIDTSKMIVDVTRMKQDEVKQDDETIHYFLPVAYPTGCQDCLYSRCEQCRYKKTCESNQKLQDI